MPQYRRGTARVSSANPNTVTLDNFGVTTGNISPGNWFKLVGDSGFWFIVDTVLNATTFTLTVNYNGSKPLDADLAYIIVRDFTPFLKLPEIAPGDIETAHVYTRAARLLDAILTGVTTVSTNYTVTSSDRVILVSGTTTLTLPQASTVVGKSLTIKKTDEAGVVTIDGFSTELIEGLLTYQLTGQYQSVTLVSNGSQWFITSDVTPTAMRPTGPDGTRIVFDNIVMVEFVKLLSGGTFTVNSSATPTESVLLARTRTAIGIDRIFMGELVAILVPEPDEP